MTPRALLISSLLIISAFCLGVVIGEGGGERVATARLAPQIAALTLERDGQDAHIASLTEAITIYREAATFTGNASYYGTFEEGNQTANRETFDRHAMTAAVPFPLKYDMYWQVTRADTGKTITVWANDRLSQKWGRVVDLSEAAARALGFEAAGLARVTMTPKIGRGD